MSNRLIISHYEFVASPTEELSEAKTMLFRMVKPCHFWIDGGEDFKLQGVIPEDFEFDFASVPKCLKWAISDAMLYGFEAALHDHLYKIGCPKLVADGIFNEAMRQNKNIPAWQRIISTAVVAVFGWPAYNAHREAKG